MPDTPQCRKIAAVLVLFALPALTAEPELTVAYRPYSLTLTTYAPTPGRLAGLLMSVRVNGGPPLRLLLDTGATDLVLDQKAARRSGLETASEMDMVCAGNAPVKSMKSGLADTIEIGPLAFRNYRVNVVKAKLGEGLDGVVPISLFRGFLVRLDLANKTLDLTPYAQADRLSTEGFAATFPSNNLLFVRATLNGTLDGYVLIDTGSSYTAVSRATADAFRSRYMAPVDLSTVAGALIGDYIRPGVRFQIGAREFRADPVLALDMSNINRYHSIEVTGLLGYPDLRSKVLTVNYRDSLVKIE